LEPLRAGAVVFAKDVPKMAAFYRAVLSIDVLESEATHVLLGSRLIELTLHAIPPEIAVDISIDDPPSRREDAAIKLMFPVASITEARVTAASLGGIIDPEDRVWEFRGTRVCDGHDPEGNVIQVREQVGSA
jgi:hypothetical protein